MSAQLEQTNVADAVARAAKSADFCEALTTLHAELGLPSIDPTSACNIFDPESTMRWSHLAQETRAMHLANYVDKVHVRPMQVRAVLDEMRQIQNSRETSRWLSTGIATALARDPIDAAADADTLAELLRQRADALLGVVSTKREPLTPRELATLTAALKEWAHSLEANIDLNRALVTNSGEFEPLSKWEVSALAERLNLNAEEIR